nr:MAG TPA: hypothetical protein [Caudoviricetes sp.]
MKDYTIPLWVHFLKQLSDSALKYGLYLPFKQFVHFEPEQQKSLDFSRLLASSEIISILT